MAVLPASTALNPSAGELDGLAQTFWPDHCAQQTEGAALHPLLNQKAIDAVFHKGENPAIDSYSAFSITDIVRKRRWTRGYVTTKSPS